MKGFVRDTGIAAALPIANMDTDQIIPSRFLKGVTREGLGRGLLAPLRYRADGSEEPSFVLNRDPWRAARFLVARENFGCGSSREHAPWALAGFGIRAILAPSFADIFENNCIKNGILPARLPASEIEQLLLLAADADTAAITVDLESRKVVAADGREFALSIDADKREALLQGRDEIAGSLEQLPAIEAFEAVHLLTVPPIILQG
jgi:3-isopropylmalate/(R)-2-methylmalate dehydratase small subunit